jgi:hypothetical protein
MSKAILVMDMPDRCWKCSACAYLSVTNEYWCCAKDRFVDPDSKPDWCPLKPAPEKYDIEELKQNPHDRDCTWEFEGGYNACIDEILEE